MIKTSLQLILLFSNAKICACVYIPFPHFSRKLKRLEEGEGSFTVRYQISHTITYSYSQPVTLAPHVVRLRPRSDGWQTLQSFSLLVMPAPIQQSPVVDLEGNAILKVWFQPEQTTSLVVQALSQVETHCTDPFNYLLEDWALRLPIDYPTSLLAQLQPYLGYQDGRLPVDPVAIQLAQEICLRVQGDTSRFLTELNQQIYQTCKYAIRDTGEPLPPGITWTKQTGSCRDLSVLFMEVCRAIGLAARFVSGYQEGDQDNPERHLHAWVEVYLPGAGWRGFDPTHGLAVSDRNIALAASAFPTYTAPSPGAFTPAGIPWNMDYQLMIQRWD